MSLDIFAKKSVENREEILALIDNETLRNKVDSLLDEEIFSLNITHNLGKMANAAGFYKKLWHLERIEKCEDLLPYIEYGIIELESNPIKYKEFSAKNNWGTYEQFIPWLKDLAEKLKIEPKATLYTSR